jgi:hypothetical protein
MTQELQVPNGNSKWSGLYQRGNIEGVGRYAGFPKMQAAVSSSNQWLWAAGFQMRDPSIGRRMDELNARGISFHASRALLASHDESGTDDGRLSLKRWNR